MGTTVMDLTNIVLTTPGIIMSSPSLLTYSVISQKFMQWVWPPDVIDEPSGKTW